MTRQRLSIIQKGLLVTLMPLLFQGVFLGVFVKQLWDRVRDQEALVDGNAVALHLTQARLMLLQARDQLRDQVSRGGAEAARAAEASAAAAEAAMKKTAALTDGKTPQNDRFADLQGRFRAALNELRETVRMLGEGDRSGAMNPERARHSNDATAEFTEGVDAWLREQAANGARRIQEVREATRRLAALVIGASVLNAGGCIGAALLLHRGIRRRIAILIENMDRMIKGKPLAQPIPGEDEVCALDHSFHHMAQTLERSREKEVDYKLELEQRYEELSHANAELDQKNRENEMFVYSVSHDLRSPLVNLQGFSKELELTREELQEIVEGEWDDSARKRAQALVEDDMPESIRFIQVAVTRLSSIIDALLRLSRAGRVEYRPEMVNLNVVVHRVLSSMRSSIEQRKAQVTYGDLPPVWGDPTAVEQVFANIIGNAVAYLNPERSGRVEISLAERVGSGEAAGMVVYAVKDNGLGIAAAHLPKVFAIFQRLHPSAAPGEGVGLALVRRILERHGGKVWVESREGEGSTFFIAFPGRERSPLVYAPRKESIRLAPAGARA